MPRERYTPQNRFVSNSQIARTRARLQQRGASSQLVDPVVDQQWMQDYDETATYNPYLDYFFTGADIEVRIAELDGDEDHNLTPLPIQRINFSVQQQKRPVFGFASYTYDAMLRGNRIIQGQFALLTRYPEYMQRVLSKAAQNRAERQGELMDAYSAYRGLTEDDANIDRYWSRNLDPAVSATGKNEFSIHPPFNIIIMYGHEDTWVDNLGDVYDAFENNAAFTDFNQRLVDEPLDNESNKIMLEACELHACNRPYEPQADPLMEIYQFTARDIIIPNPRTQNSGMRSRRSTQ